MCYFCLLHCQQCPTLCHQTETAQAVKPKRISVVSKWCLKATEWQSQGIPNPMTPGVIGRNELDMHADACCTGANWKLLEVANQACEVSPFLDSCDPVKEIPGSMMLHGLDMSEHWSRILTHWQSDALVWKSVGELTCQSESDSTVWYSCLQ